MSTTVDDQDVTHRTPQRCDRDAPFEYAVSHRTVRDEVAAGVRQALASP